MEKKNNMPLYKGPGRQGMMLSVMIIIPVIMGWFIFVQQAQSVDNRLLESSSRLIHPDLTVVMKAVSFLGSHRFLVPANLLLIAFLFFRKENKLALQTLLIALSSLGLMSLLKNLFKRIRPDHPLVEGISNYSFPSGHALMSVAFFGWLILLTKEKIRERMTRNIFIIPLLVLILLIGFSRVYLRVHYPSDVLAGYCIGIVWISCCLMVFRKTRLR